MNKALTTFALQCLLLGVYGCSDRSTSLKGSTIKGKSYEAEAQPATPPAKAPLQDPTQGPTDSSPPPSNNGADELEDLYSVPSERVNVPAIVSGTYLTCAVDIIDEAKDRATSVCQLRDEKTRKLIDPDPIYRSIKWSAIVPAGVEIVEIRDLVPNNSFWHASFTFKSLPAKFKDVSSKIVYKVDAIRIEDGAVLKLEQSIVGITPPSFYLQSQFAHGAEALRCLDFSFDIPPDNKGLTRACSAIPGQRMNFRADGTIGLNFPEGNQCMTYDPGNVDNQYVVPKPCNAAALPRPIIPWQITGQELRWRGSNFCLARAPIQTGNTAIDYIGMQICDGSTGQRWEIIPF